MTQAYLESDSEMQKSNPEHGLFHLEESNNTKNKS